MNRAPVETRARALNMLLEGMSMRATARVTGLSLTTIKRLLGYAGGNCIIFHDKYVVGLRPRHVQCDELWSFCYAKDEMRVKGRPHDWAGDLWTWIAIDEDTKMILAYHVGGRDTENAIEFMQDLGKRIVGKFKMSTDGYKPYIDAVLEAFSRKQVQHVRMIKELGIKEDRDGMKYAHMISGSLDDKGDYSEFGTSHVESHNLTIRMSNKRYSRLTNAFSRKAQSHLYQTALYVVWYNWIRPHSTLTKRNGGKPTTPAMAANKATRPFSLEDLVRVIDAANPPGPRGKYQPRTKRPEQVLVRPRPSGTPVQQNDEPGNDSTLVRVVRRDW